PEELGSRGRGHPGRVLRSQGAYAPGTIARTPYPGRRSVKRMPTHGKRSGIAAVLREARQVHHRARAGTPREPRLLDGADPRLEGQVRFDLGVIDPPPGRSGRAHDLDGDRSDPGVQPVCTQDPRRTHTVLDAPGDYADGGVDYP